MTRKTFPIIHIIGPQTIYYWLKKGWVKPKRDYRDYPVFTVLDIENIINWRNSLKKEGISTL